jgi:hypothetical protein
MKNLTLVLLIGLVALSCNKWKGEKKENLVYYSTDYKEKNVTILDASSADIDAVWVEFYKTGKSKDYNNYALVVKANGEITKELGTCQIDWKNSITFQPDNGSSYIGTWVSGKEKYSLILQEDSRSETLYFVYKPSKKCGKGKK